MGPEAQLWQAATAILDDNWSGEHTVPSRVLYPHQWSWDSAFIGIGLARHDPARAWQDLRSLFAAQWPDGRVPHIVFDPGVAERDYFPGPAFWQVPASMGAGGGRATSGLVQPPVHAIAAWRMYEHTGALDELRWLYPRLVAQQDYLARNRDVGRAGLVSIVHPWESGQDNSPAWDPALRAVAADTGELRRYRRRDTQVAAAHRPTDEDYARYLLIAESYRDGGYADADLAQRHPFLVECPAFNAFNGAAERALAQIAAAIGADPAPHRDRAARITLALLDRLYDPATGMCHGLDLRTGRRSPVRCVGGLLALLLPDLPAAQVASMLAAAVSPGFGLTEPVALPLPSYDREAADFDPLRYWRGPIWININWLLWRALLTHGRPALAASLRAAMLDLIRRSGCYEYFHGLTGSGIGSPTFSWTAALALDLLADA